jgi:predicted nuclease of restriction endonuclease-like (RecB) superfamily
MAVVAAIPGIWHEWRCRRPGMAGGNRIQRIAPGMREVGAGAGLPADYRAVLENIRARIRTAKVGAALSVNRELVRLYWEIGGLIVRRQDDAGWGRAVIERLAADIQQAFPGLRGFSRQNIWRMRAFYVAWSSPRPILAQPVRELPEGEPPPLLLGIPWGHNILLMQQLKDSAERLWYAHQTIVNGWSRSMLQHWIRSGLYARQGSAVTNFDTTLPPPQSDLARQIVRDPYSFDFLTLRTESAERDLERGLLANMRRFLLELGTGFAFVGQQVPVEVDGETFYLDLLFYHLTLRCFVVVELKTARFRPEFAGKMNFYLSAVDDRLRHPEDRPSLGLILCRSRSRVIAEYALRELNKPIGVSRWATRIVPELPAELRGVLPSPEQITDGLGPRGERQA